MAERETSGPNVATIAAKALRDPASLSLDEIKALAGFILTHPLAGARREPAAKPAGNAAAPARPKATAVQSSAPKAAPPAKAARLKAPAAAPVPKMPAVKTPAVKPRVAKEPAPQAVPVKQSPPRPAASKGVKAEGARTQGARTKAAPVSAAAPVATGAEVLPPLRRGKTRRGMMLVENVAPAAPEAVPVPVTKAKPGRKAMAKAVSPPSGAPLAAPVAEPVAAPPAMAKAANTGQSKAGAAKRTKTKVAKPDTGFAPETAPAHPAPTGKARKVPKKA